MTIFADVCGVDVISRFASCRRTIMATNAIGDDARVIETCRCPCVGGVTYIASRCRGNVVYRLAGRNRIIVTSRANADNLVVINVS